MGNTIIGAASGEFVLTTPKDSQSQAAGQKTLDISLLCLLLLSLRLEKQLQSFFVSFVFRLEIILYIMR
ncbi:hypothetical protein GCM10011351_15480 [Paraliobacillus quinghaiensis]|uniref:Uncharacterized protein n=1 Tax=Paraliobacillus quinghaiensis TaxID=470815 RepID=A0A917TQJ1_9BACI|nr:hypothetical protein GCM10011351_15480 [Paraliobacillus quinghaiensis]